VANAVTPQDVVYTYTNGQPTGVQVTSTEPLFVSATGNVNVNAAGSVTIQSTRPDITLGQVGAGGDVNVTAPDAILGTGTGTQINTPDDTVLKVETGTVGQSGTPLAVAVGGLLHVYTPPNSAYLTGKYNLKIPTQLALSPNPASPVTYGQTETFTALVTPTLGTNPPTGSVEFYDGTTDLGPGTALGANGTSATWTFTISTLAAGLHPGISAIYTPTGIFEGSHNSVSLMINKAPLTITAKDEQKTYGTTFTPDDTKQFSVHGLVNSDSVAGVTLTSSGYAPTATVVAPGPTYAITPRAAVGTGLSNYNITYVNGTFTVKPAPLTLTAANENKTYGTTFTPDGTRQFTICGLVNSDSVSSVRLTSGGYASTATVVAPGPTYAIAPSAATGSGLGNYTISYVNGTFTVIPAPLTITANSVTKTYGQAVTFGATAFSETGLVTANGDTITGVTETSDGAAGSATVTAPGPNYAIVPSAATGTGLGNYTITYVNGTVTVNPAPLTITANDADKSWGTTITFSPTAFTEVGLFTIYGDSITSVTETSLGATAAAPVGSYPIIISNAQGNRLGNYTITYVNGTLKVCQSVIILDPTADGALTVTGNAVISLCCGGVYVDSSSSKALTANGNAQITASVINVHGGDKVDGVNVVLNPTPTLGAAVLPDPLANLAQPSTSGLTNCGSVNLTGGALTITPGIYSQISVSGTGSLTMSSGVYIIEGGDFQVTGQATVTGSGVMIFNAGSNYPSKGGSCGSLNVSGSTATVTLTPPSTGPYAGIVYFQSRDNTKTTSVSGNGVVASPGGVVYVPAAQVSLTGNAMLETTILVDDLFMSGNADPCDVPYSQLLQEIAARKAAAVDPAALRSDKAFVAGEMARADILLSAVLPSAPKRLGADAEPALNWTDDPATAKTVASRVRTQGRAARGKRLDRAVVDQLFSDLEGLGDPW
jgi:hypothetical protein